MRIPTDYGVTRKQKRYIARLKVEQEQKKETQAALKKAKEEKKKPEKSAKLFKHSYFFMKKGKFTTYTKEPSFFAKNWRKYTEGEN